MAKLTSFILTLSFLILPITCILRECRRQRQVEEEGGAAALYVFGDSFFDSGNNDYINTTTLYLANYWPYGETFFHFPTGRFSDGRLMSDFIGKDFLSTIYLYIHQYVSMHLLEHDNHIPLGSD